MKRRERSQLLAAEAMVTFAKSILDPVVFTAFENRFANHLDDLWHIYLTVCDGGTRDLQQTVGAAMGILMIKEAETSLGNRTQFAAWKAIQMESPQKLWRTYAAQTHSHGTGDRLLFLASEIEAHGKK